MVFDNSAVQPIPSNLALNNGKTWAYEYLYILKHTHILHTFLIGLVVNGKQKKNVFSQNYISCLSLPSDYIRSSTYT